MHLVVHISLSLATAAINDYDVDDDESDNDCDNSSHTDSLAVNYSRFLYEFFLVKGLEALIRWACKASADRIEDAEWLDLASISLPINDYRGVNIGAIVLPVRDFIIYIGVADLALSPDTLICTTETILHTLLGLVPINLGVFMSTSRAVLINHRVALRMHSLHIFPPFHGLVTVGKVVPHA